MKGVDISHYQAGLTIRQLRDAGKEFAVIKLTEGDWLVDDSAFSFYHEAYALAFPVGCYCYSHAVTPQQAAAEAEHLLGTLNGFPMPCGVFLDVEEPKQLGLDHDALLNILRSWCASVAGRGYIPGVYGSAGTLWAKISPDELPDSCLVWVAKWGGSAPDTPCDLWQSSDRGQIAGYAGPVDTDEARSARLATLVETGGAEYGYHSYHNRNGKTDERPAAGESAVDLLIAYLKTEEFAQNYKSFTERSSKNECT